MGDYFIPNISSTALSLLLAYINDKLPDHERKFNEETGDMTIYAMGYVDQDRLTDFLEIMNNMTVN